MSMIIASALPAVNPTRAELATADRLAWLNDAPTNDVADGYPGPGWQDTADRDPASIEDEYHEVGYAIGLLGESPSYDTVNPDHSWLTRLIGLTPYRTGHALGLAEHARRLGHAAGLDGEPPVLPAAVHWRQALPFVQGHAAGRQEREEREEEMGRYFARLDFEQELVERERCFERLAREAGGWDRVHPSMVD